MNTISKKYSDSLETVVSWPGGEGATPTKFFQNRRIFGNSNASSENFWTFAAGKDKGFEFYRKIFELGPPTLQVPRWLET